MYSFLVLLPLTLITASLGGVLISSPQVSDYVDFIAVLDANPEKSRLAIQIAAHIATYALCLFVLVATTRTITAPVPRDKPNVLCRFQMALEAIFVAVPSVIILALATKSTIRDVEQATGVQVASLSPELIGPSPILFIGALAAGALSLAALILSGRPKDMRQFGVALVVVVTGIPTALWLGLLAAALPTGKVSMLLTLAAAVGAVGLAGSVAAVVLVKRPLELFQSSLTPFRVTLVDSVAGLAVVACVAFGASLIWRPVDGATFLGMFPVMFLVSAVALIIVAAVFAKGSSPVAIASVAISAMVIMHGLDFLLPTREFRYKEEVPAAVKQKLDAGAPVAPDDFDKDRNIMDLRRAFLGWLDVRRDAIKAYADKGKTYPVIVVAAQGGGVYAAYHSALSLARLYDVCPEIVDHMFVLSGVSGGALGSAVFTELVRSMPEAYRTTPGKASGCNPRPGAPKLEEKVKTFFATDFLTPVVGSALLFDFPSLFVPWLRLGMNRASALEFAFEDAWRKTIKAKLNAPHGKQPPPTFGLEANFYGRWTPDGPAPALLLGATAVNSGNPVILSQIKWSQGQSLRLGGATTDGRKKVAEELTRRAQAQSERKRSSLIANILDFRPDLQLTVSTAVGLSARFPYVTPPGNINRHPKIEPAQSFYGNIKTLELLDGAYFDNSASWVAIDLIDDLERYLRPRKWNSAAYEDFKPFANDIRFHLIRFTDRPAQRKAPASEEEHFELIAPLIAFNTVRSARGAQLRGLRGVLERTEETYFYLSDPWFTPSLNWLLSQETKAGIELRTFGKAMKAEDELCCLLTRQLPPDIQPGRRREGRELLLVATWDEAKKAVDELNQAVDEQNTKASDQKELRWEVSQFVPNNTKALERMLELVNEGDRPAEAR